MRSKLKPRVLSPYLESLKIYFIFLRYTAVSLSSFVIDVGVFALIYWLSKEKFTSLLIGRLVSGSFNFYFNKYLVYRSLDKVLFKREAFRYAILAIGIFFVSYYSISELTVDFHFHVIEAKIFVDIVLFCMNFLIQRFLFRTGMIKASE
ncbi:GtrA family protein [Coxiella burnetii]|uniref:GtrA family protein n=1 Tax=Coxiella burnetii TaxID=777 RepID=UPI0000ED0375|nr:GtrA family protein [Coxiella burnetii]ACJ20634.1 hypothetical membrane spanning protein [Coxiella burnetii CbuK_Q154]EAX33037.1 hypothetical protein A35_07475 [Coxiella burnetii 'MSU Goat Q177']UYK69150.1 GtrA family protein [Coxiella burnetii]